MMGKPWTKAQHAKFAATSKRKRKAGEWATGVHKAKKTNGKTNGKAMMIPLDVIPARTHAKPRVIHHDDKRLQLAMAVAAVFHKILEG